MRIRENGLNVPYNLVLIGGRGSGKSSLARRIQRKRKELSYFSLDPLIRSELQSDLKDIFKTLGKTVVMVTHDIGEATFLADKIVFLNEGEIVQAGKIGELLSSPKDPFITRFINAQRSPLELAGDTPE